MVSFMLIHTGKQPQDNVNHLPQNVDFITMTEVSQSNCAPLPFILFFLPISQTFSDVQRPEAQSFALLQTENRQSPKWSPSSKLPFPHLAKRSWCTKSSRIGTVLKEILIRFHFKRLKIKGNLITVETWWKLFSGRAKQKEIICYLQIVFITPLHKPLNPIKLSQPTHNPILPSQISTGEKPWHNTEIITLIRVHKMGLKLDLLNLPMFCLEWVKTESKDMLKWLNKSDRNPQIGVSRCNIQVLALQKAEITSHSELLEVCFKYYKALCILVGTTTHA